MSAGREGNRPLLAVGGLAGLLGLIEFASLGPSPARGGDTCVGHPSEASVVCVRNNDTRVDVCDRHEDGHRVYARVITQESRPSYRLTGYDDNGSNSGCGNFPQSSRVLSIAVCVQSEGCSTFKATGAPAAPTTSAPGAAPSAPRPAGNHVIYAAGDISCDYEQRQRARKQQPNRCKSRETYRKIREVERSRRGNAALPDAVLALGDIQYEVGARKAFDKWYHRDWGALNPVIRPAVGNHEYRTPNADGYWGYFRNVLKRLHARKQDGWYAFSLGSWRLYAINSNCERRDVRCDRRSAQYRWLVRDMRRNPRRCRLMFMHHPYWDSSKNNFNTPALRPLIEAFHRHGGDVVLAGHAHDYERFARSNPHQQRDGRGFRLFIVGTGGKNQLGLGAREPNSEALNNTDHGVLQLSLGNEDYGWRFYSAFDTDGHPFADSGREQC